MIRSNIGKVYLVGAGPGDPELLTVKAMRLLKQADSVIYDRLVNPEILEYCDQSAELIDAGKYPDHHRVTQEQINQIIVDRAVRGMVVVRLKGGDPFVFGRASEEREACENANIPCQVVPGISSCIAGPASAGIPVTSRGVARSFAVVTGQTDPNLPEYQIQFDALAKLDTVIFMMGRRNLSQLMGDLIKSGKDPSTPVACIQKATTSNQKTVVGKLSDIVEKVENAGLESPMISIVGDVVNLSDQLQHQPELQSIEAIAMLRQSQAAISQH